MLLTDTVGFIQKLPTNLVAAFRATLEEITEADVLLVSQPDRVRVLRESVLFSFLFYHNLNGASIDLQAQRWMDLQTADYD